MIRRQQQTSVSPINNPSSSATTIPAASKSEIRRKRRTCCLTWTNLALSALIPLMIGIFTVVSYVQQQTIDDRRRKQDQEIAKWTRQQDQQQADELHYQNVYKTYMDDILNILFKVQLSNETSINNRTRLLYIRSKTLMTFDELDWQRKTRLFVFLYEQKLLPQSSVDESLDLSGANLFNITSKSSLIRKFQFRKLSLPSVDLTNASFLQCEFREGVSFSGASMTNAKFMGSSFFCSRGYANTNDSLGKTHVLFDSAILTQADFRNTILCDVNFNAANLMYANFNRATFQGKIDIVGTNLAYANFAETLFNYPIFVNVYNANLTGAELNSDQLNRIKERGDFKMRNVILPNGTWSIDERNFVLNGNAEVKCATHSVSNWIKNNGQYYSYPTVFNNQNSTYSCSFNFTVNTEEKPVSMYQDINISHFSIFIDTGATEYKLLADVGSCERGTLTLIVAFYSPPWTRVSVTSSNYTSNSRTEKFEWNRWFNFGEIPTNVHHLRIQFLRQERGPCFLDNVELRIQRGSKKI